MSSKKAKSKKVSQNDLRKMMNEMKTKRTGDTKSRGKDGQALLKNADAYKKALNDRKKLQALIGGMEKRDSASEFIENNQTLISKSNTACPNDPTKTLKRPYPTKAPNDMTIEIESEQKSKISKTEAKPENAASGLLIGDYSSASEDEDMESEPQQKQKSETSSAKDKAGKEADSSLPEGFFDDPEVDAKMRGVETPADAMDREWDDFQKEIQRETDQSEQIVEEEEEVEKVDREIEEIDEQIMHFSRVEKLSNTRDEIKQKSENGAAADQNFQSDEDDSDSDDVDDMLDWREKDSYL